jgi:hypothetical protein
MQALPESESSKLRSQNYSISQRVTVFSTLGDYNPLWLWPPPFWRSHAEVTRPPGARDVEMVYPLGDGSLYYGAPEAKPFEVEVAAFF